MEEDIYEKTVSNYELNKKSIKKAASDSYFVTIIDNDGLKVISLKDFYKKNISFGRGEDNDIVIKSKLVSTNHGHFILGENLKIIDNDSTNGLFINKKLQKELVLDDGDFIKIDNPDEPLSDGVIMLITIGTKEEWKLFDIADKTKVTIGRNKKSDIVLNHIGVSNFHATITKNNNSFYIEDNDSTNGTTLNGEILEGKKQLKEKDVILITTSKLIFTSGKIIYQTYNKGVKLEAFDIVKTVKTKKGNKDISSHINLAIKPGEFVALVGGSGAGKSTFMNCISGFSKPTSGVVKINDENLYDNYSVLKSIIGYVPQQDIVYTNLKLIDMLKYSADLRMPKDISDKEKLSQINKVLKIVELEDKKDIYIRQLSGGQRKRASIAVELIADPNLFFLDEPTSGLDPGTERSIMKTLRNMADSGKTVILVTHNTLNLHLCDKVVFIGVGGKLCFSGKPEQAKKFFEVDDFVDIYTILNNDTNTWNNKFLSSEYYEKLSNDKDKISEKTERKVHKSFISQLVTLTKRYSKLICNDKTQLILLLLQAPLIALLLSFVSNKEMFVTYDDTKAILFSMACSCVWLGLLNSIQEVCKERVILKKEYMADLKISAYLFSKFLVQGLLALIQSFLLVTVFMILFNPDIDGVLKMPYLEILITCFITIISSSSLGILISSIAKNSNIAMSIAPILLVPQLLFSGMLFELKGLADKISYLIVCRWSVSSLGTIANLNSLPSKYQLPNTPVIREAEDYFTFSKGNLLEVNIIMIIMSIILFIASAIILKRQLDKLK